MVTKVIYFPGPLSKTKNPLLALEQNVQALRVIHFGVVVFDFLSLVPVHRFLPWLGPECDQGNPERDDTVRGL